MPLAGFAGEVEISPPIAGAKPALNAHRHVAKSVCTRQLLWLSRVTKDRRQRHRQFHRAPQNQPLTHSRFTRFPHFPIPSLQFPPTLSARRGLSMNLRALLTRQISDPCKVLPETVIQLNFSKESAMASRSVARVASVLWHVTALLILFLVLAQHAAAAGESNAKAVQHGRGHYYPDKNLHVYPKLQRKTPALEEAEDTEATSEPHPADELLQSQDADGSQSYILGGY